MTEGLERETTSLICSICFIGWIGSISLIGLLVELVLLTAFEISYQTVNFLPDAVSSFL
jgi:hypothetical protein